NASLLSIAYLLEVANALLVAGNTVGI
ncbi:MAG: hypothetical protein JWO85_2797, partial [Candidatus Eremiobacteraeota bacterium]|nr:hypothetical protein [Candidatus Eremiobacteraeota bacterium]